MVRVSPPLPMGAKGVPLESLRLKCGHTRLPTSLRYAGKSLRGRMITHPFVNKICLACRIINPRSISHITHYLLGAIMPTRQARAAINFKNLVNGRQVELAGAMRTPCTILPLSRVPIPLI